MTGKHKVKAVIEGFEGEINISGGGINKSNSSDSENVVDATIKNAKAKINISGDDIYNQASAITSELLPLLLQGAVDKKQRDDIKEIVASVLEQSKKPPEQQDVSVIKQIIDNLAKYVGVAALATNQVEKLQGLFFQLKGLILGG